MSYDAAISDSCNQIVDTVCLFYYKKRGPREGQREPNNIGSSYHLISYPRSRPRIAPRLAFENPRLGLVLV
jgi:hypothetical protein